VEGISPWASKKLLRGGFGASHAAEVTLFPSSRLVLGRPKSSL